MEWTSEVSPTKGPFFDTRNLQLFKGGGDDDEPEPAPAPSATSIDCSSRFNDIDGYCKDESGAFYPYCDYIGISSCQQLAEESMLAVGWIAVGNDCAVYFDKQHIPAGAGESFCPGSPNNFGFNSPGTGAVSSVTGTAGIKCYVCT